MGRGKHRSNDPTEPQQLHRVAKQPGKDVTLTSQSKNIINRVRQYFEGGKKGTHMKRTAAATGVPMATVKLIYSNQRCHDGQFLTPVRRYAAFHI